MALMEHHQRREGNDPGIKRSFDWIIRERGIRRCLDYQHCDGDDESRIQRQADPEALFQRLDDGVLAVHTALFSGRQTLPRETPTFDCV